MIWSRPKREFKVTVELYGRHPYLESHHLDYEDGHEDVFVMARGWDDAERKALYARTRQSCWMKRVFSITAVPREKTL